MRVRRLFEDFDVAARITHPERYGHPAWRLRSTGALIPGPAGSAMAACGVADRSTCRCIPRCRSRGVVRPEHTKGEEIAHSSPLSTYNAPGGLRQDPGRTAESPHRS